MMMSNFTPEALALMGTVCDEAFASLRGTTSFPTANEEYEVRHRMATRSATPSNSRSLRYVRR